MQFLTRLLAAGGVAALAGAALDITRAAVIAQSINTQVPGMAQADVHNPYSDKYLPLLPNQPVKRGPNVTLVVPSGGTFWFGGPWYNSWYGYSPYYPGPIYAPYPLYDPYTYGGSYVLPPLVLPAEALYGPQAGRHFWGLGNGAIQPPAGRIDLRRDNDDFHADRKDRPRRRVARATNPETRARANKFVQYGDNNFAKQKYLAALERYRTASETTPDVPEMFLRQAIANVAMSNYNPAIAAVRRALALPDLLRDTPLRLDDLYGANKVAKTAHVETLAKAAEADPQNGELMALVGTFLYLDGQPARAEKFFRRATQLGANEDHLLDELFPPQQAAGLIKEPLAVEQ